MMNIFTKNSKATVTIDGKSFSGNNIQIKGNKVIVDGQSQDGELIGNISVEINGNVDSLTTGSGDVVVHGDANSIKTGSGDVNIDRNVAGNVSTGSGDVDCGTINGNISTGSGNIIHE